MKSIKRILIFIIISTVVAFPVFSQNPPAFYQYSAYEGLANPAIPFSGYNGHHNIALNASFRSEGTGADGPSMETAAITIIPKKGNIFRPILRANFNKKSFGPTSYIDYFFSIGAIQYARPNNIGLLSLALTMGSNQIRLNALETSGLAPSDPLLNSNYKDNIPNIGFGIYYKSQSQFNNFDFSLGFSVPRIGQYDLINYSVIEGDLSNQIGLQHAQYHGLLGLTIYQGAYNYWELTTWIKKFPETDVVVDILSLYHYHFKKLAPWIGIGLSSECAMRTEIRFNFNSQKDAKGFLAKSKKQYVKIGIAYNRHFGAIPNPLNNGMEVTLTWILPQ